MFEYPNVLKNTAGHSHQEVGLMSLLCITAGHGELCPHSAVVSASSRLIIGSDMSPDNQIQNHHRFDSLQRAHYWLKVSFLRAALSMR